MTLRDGRIVYELNGLARPNWDTLPKNYGRTGNPRWEGGRDSGGGRPRPTQPPAAKGAGESPAPCATRQNN